MGAGLPATHPRLGRAVSLLTAFGPFPRNFLLAHPTDLLARISTCSWLAPAPLDEVEFSSAHAIATRCEELLAEQSVGDTDDMLLIASDLVRTAAETGSDPG
jgi:hypothetical protein